MPPTILRWLSCGLNLTHCYSEALSFCKVPKTGAIMLLGVRQVGLLGPLLWQECHKEEKQKLKMKNESMRPEKRSSRSLPLNTLAVLPHKELGHKGFDTSFHSPPAGNGGYSWDGDFSWCLMERADNEFPDSVWLCDEWPQCLGAFDV